eukprot:c39997_g1_i1 orf=184-702(+)
MFSTSSRHKLRCFLLPFKSLRTVWQPSPYNPRLLFLSFSVSHSVSISPSPFSPYEAPNSEAKHWSSDLNQFFERLYTVRKVHALLKDMCWIPDLHEKLRTLNVVFNVEIVCQVVRGGHIPPATCLSFFYWLRDEHMFIHTFYTYDAVIGMLREHGFDNDMSRVIEDYRGNTS